MPIGRCCVLTETPLLFDSTIELAMKLLRDIKSFPSAVQEMLEQQFGVASAEAFFERATRNSLGVQTALGLSQEQLDALVRLVEGYLTAEFVKRTQQPVVKHSRGVIMD